MILNRFSHHETRCRCYIILVIQEGRRYFPVHLRTRIRVSEAPKLNLLLSLKIKVCHFPLSSTDFRDTSEALADSGLESECTYQRTHARSPISSKQLRIVRTVTSTVTVLHHTVWSTEKSYVIYVLHVK